MLPTAAVAAAALLTVPLAALRAFSLSCSFPRRPGMMLVDGVMPFSEDGGRVMPFSEAGRAHTFEADGGRVMSFSVVAVDGR